MKRKVIMGVLLTVLSGVSSAFEYIPGKVTLVQPSSLPASVTFQMDSGNATCPAGKWLTWQNPDQSNNKAVYATLMTALVSGAHVTFIISDGDKTCVGLFLWLTP